ncbi:MAG: hypothetical protein WC123_05380 [Bacilli bacterium]
MINQSIFGEKQQKVISEEPYFLKPVDYNSVDYRLVNSTNCWTEKESVINSTWLCPKNSIHKNKKTR